MCKGHGFGLSSRYDKIQLRLNIFLVGPNPLESVTVCPTSYHLGVPDCLGFRVQVFWFSLLHLGDACSAKESWLWVHCFDDPAQRCVFHRCPGSELLPVGLSLSQTCFGKPNSAWLFCCWMCSSILFLLLGSQSHFFKLDGCMWPNRHSTFGIIVPKCRILVPLS